MNDPRVMKYAMAPAIKGAIAGIAASVVLGVGASKLSLGGMVLGAPTVIGISVAGASIASELSPKFRTRRLQRPIRGPRAYQ